MMAILLVLLLLALPAATGAQVRSEGMAGSGSAILDGADAALMNPAHLAVLHGMSFRLLSTSAGVANNSFSVNDYKTYNGTHFSDADKQDILGRVDPTGFEGNLAASVEVFDLRVKSWAFGTRSRGGAVGAIPKEFFEIVFYGNTPGRTYDFANARGSAMALSEARLSHGMFLNLPRVGRWAVGASLKYLHGWGYGKIEQLSGSMRTDPAQIHGQGSALVRTALGGEGYGLDLGAWREVKPNLFASIAIQDLASSIHWNRSTKESTADFSIHDIDVQDIQNGSNLVDQTHDTHDIPGFSTSIPPVVTAGVARKMRRLILAADLTQGFQESALTTTKTRLAVGTELHVIPFFLPRAGLAVGGRDGNTLGLGLGLAPPGLRLDFSLVAKGGFVPFSGRGIGAGFSLGFGFD